MHETAKTWQIEQRDAIPKTSSQNCFVYLDYTFVAGDGGVNVVRINTASRQLIKLIAKMITRPPMITQISMGSSKIKMPNITAHTNCKKVAGCVTEMGAVLKASVIV